MNSNPKIYHLTIGILGLLICHLFFLLEIIELVGFNSLRILFSFVSFLNFSLLLIYIIPNKTLRFLGSFLYILLLWSNVLHFRYFGSTIPLGSLLNFRFLPLLDTQIAFLTQWQDLLYLLAIVYSFIVFIFATHSRYKTKLNYIFIFIAVFFGLQLFQFFAETHFPLQSSNKYNENFTRWDIYKEIRIESRDHTGSVLQFGFLWTYAMDLSRMNQKPKKEMAISLDNFTIQIPESAKRNILFIQVESLDKHIIDYTIKGVEVTPFLNSLRRSTLYFPNMYAQHTSLGGTSDAEFSILTSQYPSGNKGAFFSYGLEKLPSLTKILNSNQYTTFVFHGNSGSYFNRKNGMAQLGFQHLYFKEDLKNDDPDRWHAIKDKSFLQQVKHSLNTADTPYFAYILTLTSHTPFDLLSESDYSVRFSVNDPLLNNYFNSMAYVDNALEEFIRSIQNTDPNALIVLFGDHCANIITDEYRSFEQKGMEPIPLFIIDQTMKKMEQRFTYGSTIDIAPTILELLQTPIPSFWRGASLLNPNSDKNVFIVNSDFYLNSKGETINMTGDIADSADLYRIINYIW